MLQINRIREEKANVIAALAKRHFDAEETVNSLLETNDSKKAIQQKAEGLQAEANGIAKQIGGFYKEGKREEADRLKGRSSEIKEELKSIQEELNTLTDKEFELLVSLPNTPHESVVAGRNEEDNVEVKRLGEIPTLMDGAVPHWDLTSRYKLIDFELGVKITGAGFPVYTNKGARLQRALINYFLDQNTEAGYQEYNPPLFVNEASGFGTGQLPDKEGQMYHMPEDNLYAIPTAEVPITNMFRDVIVKKDELPIKCTAYTQCFRREAGSYGKDVRGLNRLHQFDKVELVVVSEPEKSYGILDEMVNHVAGLLDSLGLPYRILRLCGGDIGFTSALTYDFEVYSAAQEKWLEVSSVSNFENFQTNRLKLRYKDEDNKTQLCHTLNGSALALPRIMAALLENNQTENGVNIPECLVPYTGFNVIV